VPLLVGASRAAAARARVLAAPRRRGRGHGSGGLRRRARACAGEGAVSGVPQSPYKGLASFEDSELDALLFFGREREIAGVAAAQQNGELHLLLDNFEEYMLYHGVEGPLSAALPELQRRPGLRVNVLLALRDDALAELDEFAGRIPDLFSNLLRLDRLDRDAGRAAILGTLARY